MKYPGGFSDTVAIGQEALERLFPGLPQEDWQPLAEKEGLPLRKEGEGWVGAALPFLVVLSLKSIPLTPEGYYRLLEAALGDPLTRGELEEVVRKLGSRAVALSGRLPQDRGKEKGVKAPLPPRSEDKAPQTAPSQGAGGTATAPSEPPPSPQQGGEAAPAPPSPEAPSAPFPALDVALSVIVDAIGSIEERFQAVEETIEALRKEVVALAEEMGQVRDEIAVWNDHVRYLNDHYAKVEAEIGEERKEREKTVADLASRLQDLENLIHQIRQAVLPR